MRSGEEIQGGLRTFAAPWRDYSGTERGEAQTFLAEPIECYGGPHPISARHSRGEMLRDVSPRPRRVFLLGNNTQDRENLVEEAQHATRQAAFRERLADSGLTIAMVTTPGELYVALFQALVELPRAGSEGSPVGGYRPCPPAARHGRGASREGSACCFPCCFPCCQAGPRGLGRRPAGPVAYHYHSRFRLAR